MQHLLAAVPVQLHQQFIPEMPHLAPAEIFGVCIAEKVRHEVAEDAKLTAVFLDAHPLALFGKMLRARHHEVIDVLFEVGKPEQAWGDVRKHVPAYKADLIQLYTEVFGKISVEVPPHGEM